MALTREHFQEAAAALGVEMACVAAVATVESSGAGFFAPGKPACLFERHIFYREYLKKHTARITAETKAANPTLKGAQLEAVVGKAIRDLHTAVDVLIQKQSNIINTQTGGYKGGIAEYTRLEAAKNIDRECALRSCSWGAFQIMGFHAEFLGYPSVEDFMQEMEDSEFSQLMIFVKFIKKNPAILNAMKAKNWASVAKNYNGAAYAKNQYDVKLTAAYKKWSA